MIEYAVRLLCDRTGPNADECAAYQANLDFIQRHPRVLRAVKHIFEQDQEGTISGKYLSPGYASAMLYLMGASASDGDTYHRADPHSENKLDFSHWERACKFWVLLSSGSAAFKPLQFARSPALGDKDEWSSYVFPAKKSGDPGGSLAERLGVLCKAWKAFLEKGKLRPEHVQLAYNIVERGPDGEIVEYELAEHPDVGGIDRGPPGGAEGEDDAAGPTAGELEA